jgi:dihydrofolate synthase/folylpolyglutamate synthase
VLTAVAFWYFAKKKVDYAVVEVGMGGRLDATNVVIPLVSVITNIDLEHTAVLGNTLAKIAVEKAAIIKPRVPVITAENKPEALKVLKHQAQKNGSVLIQVSPDVPTLSEVGIPTLRRNSNQITLKSGLIGEHQKANAACAVAAVRLAGIKVSKQAVLRGLQKVRWPGRFQIVSRNPLTILDGAHNPAGIRVLTETLQAKFPGKKFTFVIGVQQDKDAKNMLKEISPLASNIIVTSSSHQQAAKSIAGQRVISLNKALALTKKKDRIIAGSLFLVADAMKILDVKF